MGTPLKNLIATDLPGRYPVTSRKGNKYMFVLYNYDSNLIIAEPIKSRNASDLVNGFDTCYKALTKNGFRAKKIRLDNEISKDFIQYLNKENLTYQLASPGDHRVNPAERAIQTYKNHFIAMLSGTDPSYPTNCLDLLLEILSATLPSKLGENPVLSPRMVSSFLFLSQVALLTSNTGDPLMSK
jgi:hypothetical protein